MFCRFSIIKKEWTECEKQKGENVNKCKLDNQKYALKRLILTLKNKTRRLYRAKSTSMVSKVVDFTFYNATYCF
jgi:hypothetical protein